MNRTKNTINIKYITMVITMTCLISIAADAGHNVYSKTASSSRITIQKGKIYKLKYNRKNTYKSSNKKIASVTKKGIIKAGKCGKCIVRVIRNKRIVKKYNVEVVITNTVLQQASSTAELVQVTAIPTQTPEVPLCTATPKPKDGGWMVYPGFIIFRIDPVNEDRSRVYLVRNENKEETAFDNYFKGGIEYIVFETQNKYIGDLQKNDHVNIGFWWGLNREVKENTLILSCKNGQDIDLGSDEDPVIHYETPEPTQGPV